MSATVATVNNRSKPVLSRGVGGAEPAEGAVGVGGAEGVGGACFCVSFLLFTAPGPVSRGVLYGVRSKVPRRADAAAHARP